MEGVKIKIRKAILILICAYIIIQLSTVSRYIFHGNYETIKPIVTEDISFIAVNANDETNLNVYYWGNCEEEENWSSYDEFSRGYRTFMNGKNTLFMKIKLHSGKWTNPAIYFKGIKADSFGVIYNGQLVYRSAINPLGYGMDLDKVYSDVTIPLGRPSAVSKLVKDGDTDEAADDVLVIQLSKGGNRNVAPYEAEKAMLIGEHKDIISYTFKDSINKIVFNSIITAAAIILAILGVLFREKKDKRILLSLSLFLFCMGAYGISSIDNINGIFFDAPIIWSYIFYLSIGYAPYAFAYFFEQTFGEGYKGTIRKMRKIIALAAMMLIIANVIYSATYGIVNLLSPATILFYGVMFIEILVALTASVIGVIKGVSEAKIFTTGISIYTIYIVYAILNDRTVDEIGLLIFILSLILLTAKRFVNMSRNIMTYSKELEVKNEALQSAWDEINKSKMEVSELNKNLEKRVHDRTRELETTNTNLKEALEKLQVTQSQLIQSEKMVALGGLVAGVSHEINTPVGVSVTAASHLQEKTKEINGLYSSNTMKKSDLDKYLNLANESSEVILSNLLRASELIKSFKQVAVDQSSEEKRRFKVKEYIFQVLLSLKPKLKKTNINIGVNCDEKLEIESFPGALSQIITNLIMNSLVHAFEEGEEGAIIFDVEQQENNLIFTYSDNGKGISREIIGKIFDPFFTTKRGKGGTGLGLNIVYNIVSQTLGGSIECESEPGVGTMFKITFPIN